MHLLRMPLGMFVAMQELMPDAQVSERKACLTILVISHERLVEAHSIREVAVCGGSRIHPAGSPQQVICCSAGRVQVDCIATCWVLVQVGIACRKDQLNETAGVQLQPLTGTVGLKSSGTSLLLAWTWAEVTTKSKSELQHICHDASCSLAPANAMPSPVCQKTVLNHGNGTHHLKFVVHATSNFTCFCKARTGGASCDSAGGASCSGGRGRRGSRGCLLGGGRGSSGGTQGLNGKAVVTGGVGAGGCNACGGCSAG